MKLAVLLSGGKDSLLAAFMASHYHDIACFITIRSKNDASYMFHTPNIHLTELQAQAADIPLLIKATEGKKEEELKDLKSAIEEAKEKYQIEGVVTGALASQYQASRIQKICYELDLLAFNPLWQMDQLKVLHTLHHYHFKVIIAGVFGYPFDQSWLGKQITPSITKDLAFLEKKYRINPAGEGGEIETLVLDCPLFHKKIRLEDAKTEYDNHAGVFLPNKAYLVEKEHKDYEYSFQYKEFPQPRVTIVSTVHDKLHRLEFVQPIIDILEQEQIEYHVTHISNPEIKGEKIILTGTAILDNEFLKYKEQAHNIAKLGKPMIAICAGMELLVELDLEDVVEIGPHEILSEEFPREVYFLHQHGSRQVGDQWNVLATSKKGIAAIRHKHHDILAMQFHPEVSFKKLLSEFVTSF